MYKCKYFKLYELLPPNVYRDEWSGWETFDEKLLITLDKVRELVNAPLYINNWYWGGKRVASGYRCGDSKVGVAKSQHKEGRAVDIISTKHTAEEIRNIIRKNKDKLPYNIRLEKDVTWVHIDVKDMGTKIYEFKS